MLEKAAGIAQHQQCSSSTCRPRSLRQPTKVNSLLLLLIIVAMIFKAPFLKRHFKSARRNSPGPELPPRLEAPRCLQLKAAKNQPVVNGELGWGLSPHVLVTASLLDPGMKANPPCHREGFRVPG